MNKIQKVSRIMFFIVFLILSTYQKSPQLMQVTHKVRFTIAVDGEEIEDKVVFGLFGKDLPTIYI